MKKLFLSFILICVASVINAQDTQTTNTDSYITTDNLFLQDKTSRGFNMKANFFLPKLDDTLNRFLAFNIYGIEATLDEAKNLYYGMFKTVKEKDLRSIETVDFDIYEYYRIIPSEVVTIKYNTAGMKKMCEISAVKFVSYDFKNKKVIQLKDIVSDAVYNALASKGLAVENCTNICFDNDSLLINVGGSMLNINVSKFYTNMTDYALGIMGLSKEGLAQNKDQVQRTPAKMAEFEGGQDKLMEYLQKNVKYPTIPKDKNQDVNLLKSQQNMQRQQQVGKTDNTNRVIATFVIDKDGGLYSLKLLKKQSPYFNAEAYKCILGMPKWTPASADGQPVRMLYNLPINFQQQMRGRGFGGGPGMF